MKDIDHAKELPVKLLFLVAGGAPSTLRQAEHNRSPTEQQYQVTSKLLGILYRGMAVYEQ